MNEIKVCGKCGLSKKLNFFNYRNDTKKYRNFCKKCTKGYKTSIPERREIALNLLKEGLKECSKCKCIKSTSEFTEDKYTLTKLTSNCKECISKKYTKEQVKNTKLKSTYGIDILKFDEMVLQQGSKCLICEKTTDKLVVDHCHDSMLIRGLLCNSGLSFFKDSLTILDKAKEYLINTNTYK